MRLKTLEIFGFKSFAEKTRLDFEADIIALVGPNGCGKSNIVDAMLWVLGGQSAKTLRAEKMNDVLFAGSEGFKPFNLAEVSLTLSDVNHPIFGDDITISRRLYRDDQMQYFINKKEVRLKDIQDLFLGSGVGKSAFFVFEQGKIDEIINMSAEKRRTMFEETAGISPFLQRKRETKTQLEEVEKNYLRLKDIHAEVERQVRALQKQALKAKNYTETKTQLEALERAILLFKIFEEEKVLKELETKQKNATQRLLSYEENISQVEKDFSEITEKEKSYEREKNEMQKSFFQMQSTLKLIDVELRKNHEEQTSLAKRESKACAEQEKLKSEETKTKAEKDLYISRLNVIENEKLALEKQKADQEKQFTLLEKELSVLSQEEKQQQKSLLLCIQNENALQGKLQEKILKKESISHQIAQWEKKQEDQKSNIVDLERKVSEKKERVTHLSADIEKEKQQIEAHEKEGSHIQKSLSEALKKQDECTHKITATSAKIKATLSLQEEYVGFSAGAKALLQEAKEAKSPIFGKIFELYRYIQPEEGYERSLTMAMRFYEEVLIVDGVEHLDYIFHFISKKKIQGLSLILLEDLKKIPKKQEHSLLSHIRDNSYIFPFLNNVYPVSDLAQAFALRKEKRDAEVVTKEGIFIDRFGVFFYRGEEINDKSFFLREAELKKAQKALEALEKEKEEIDISLEKLLERKKEWETLRLSLEEKRRKKEMTLLQENFFLQRFLDDLNTAKESKGQLEKEKISLSSLLNTLEKEKEKILAELNKAKVEKEGVKNSEVDLDQKIKEKKEKLEEQNKVCNRSRGLLDKLRADFFHVKEKIVIFETKDEERKKELKKLSLELTESVSLKKNLLEKQSEWEKKKHDLLKSKDENQKMLLELEKTIHEVHSRKKVIETKLAQERKSGKELEKEMHHLSLLVTEKKTKLASLQQSLKETFPQAWESKEDFLLTMPLQEAEEKVHRLRYELANTSAVNLASIEEYTVEEKRFSELDFQLKDIIEAKLGLEKIITKLENDSRRLFKTTFEAIRVNFQKNFRVLFNGGESDLTFTKEGDVLEAGVEIIAKPPGKKMRSLSLLSGGEKCMTCLALLFALFEVKPAPFCILDEVDAPLDEANVERFTKLLKAFVEKTQFLIVTHNKKTMSASDMLIGVSMEKRGVSKLMSLVLANSHPHMATAKI